MNQPLVSVIIPNYNYGRYVHEAIDSVLSQTYSNREIIVVDDGSTDDSIEILTRYEKQITVITQKNKGVGAARNTGVAHSSGDFVAFLDSDDIWLPTKLERQLEAIFGDEKIGLVTCGTKEFETNTLATLEINLNGQSGWCANNLLSFEPVVVGPGSTSLVKRQIFEEVGGFDERKEMHPAEDWEFCYRVATISKLGFIPEVLVEYRNHGNNGHLNIARMEHAMFLAAGKIFDGAAPKVKSLQSSCYGKAHSILAGAYFQAGQYSSFASHAVKGLWYKPASILQILGYPVRLVKRRVNTTRRTSLVL